MAGPLRASVVGATMLLAALLTAWALVTPGFRGPDEPPQVSTVLRLATGGGYPAYPAVLDPSVRAAGPALGFPGLTRVFTDAGVLTARPLDLARPTAAELRSPAFARDPDTFDQMTAHPPAFATLMAAVVVVGDLMNRPIDVALLVLRLASAALLLPVPWLIARSALEVGLPAPGAGLAAFVPAGWIQFTHIGGVVNNGTLLVLGAAGLAAALLPVCRGAIGGGRAAAIGALLSLCLLTKGFALGFVPLVALAYLAAVRYRGAGATLRAASITGVLALPGLAWWAANQIRYGTIQPNELLTFDVVGPPGAWESWAGRLGSGLSSSLWADLGWLETPLPWPLHLSATAGLLAVMAVGTWRLRASQVEMAVLHGMWVLPLLLVAVGSAQVWGELGYFVPAQGRYLFTGAVAVAVCVGAVVRAPWLVRAAPALAAAVGAAGLVFGLRHFWLPATPQTALSWWSGGEVLALLVVLVGTAGVIIGVSAMHRLTAATPPRPGPEPLVDERRGSQS
jgi:hypothetical protein